MAYQNKAIGFTFGEACRPGPSDMFCIPPTGGPLGGPPPNPIGRIEGELGVGTLVRGCPVDMRY